MKKNNRKKIISDRRRFIKSSGAALLYGTAALNLGFPNSLFAGNNGNKETLRVGLIGCGGRGTGAAVQALNADPDVVLYAMADAFEDRLASSLEVMRKAHGQRVKVDKERQFVGFDAYQKLIDSGVDVVLLATPPGFRPDHLAAAVEAGKHVFYEKPVAVDGPGVRKVIAAGKVARAKNLSMVSGFCFRYHLPKQALYGRVLDGQIGKIKTLSSTRNGGGLWYKPRQPDWTDMENQMRNWYYYNWLSGDFIVEMFVHSLDMISWAMGDEVPLRATGSGGRQARIDGRFGNIYDHFATEFQYEDGVKAYTFTRQQEGASTENSLEISGTQGNAFYEGNKHLITGENSWHYQGESNDMYQTEQNVLFSSIREGKGINDVERAANSTMMGILGRMVAYSGQTITWEEAMNSKKLLGPEQYSWDLDYEGPGIAVPGVTKVLV